MITRIEIKSHNDINANNINNIFSYFTVTSAGSSRTLTSARHLQLGVARSSSCLQLLKQVLSERWWLPAAPSGSSTTWPPCVLWSWKIRSARWLIQSARASLWCLVVLCIGLAVQLLHRLCLFSISVILFILVDCILISLKY